VGSNIDSYINSMYFNKQLHIISSYWQHKSLYTGCLMWTVLVQSGISFYV